MSESVVVAAVTGVLALAGTTTTALLSQRAQHADAGRRDDADLRGLLEDERRAHREDRDRYQHALQHIRVLLALLARERRVLPGDLPAPPPDVEGDL